MQYNPGNLSDRTKLAADLEDMLAKSGFVKIDTIATEDIYKFAIKQIEGVTITVYSSIVNGIVRAAGSDAIRVTVVYARKDGGYRQLFSEKRINRTGDIETIVARTQERMREAYKTLRDSFSGENYKTYTCYHCGAPKFLSKTKKLVCSETCWIK
jgi:hypothetical protein